MANHKWTPPRIFMTKKQKEQLKKREEQFVRKNVKDFTKFEKYKILRQTVKFNHTFHSLIRSIERL